MAVLIAFSCDQDASHVLPRYSGAPGELLVVMNEQLYEDRAGDIIHEYFGAYHTMLPQGEPLFDIVQLNESQVNTITRQHRNLLFVNISSSIENARIEAQKSKWASEQLVVTIYAGSVDQLDSLMEDNGPSIVEKYNEYERSRLQSYYNSKKHHLIADSLQSMYDISLTVPNDCDIAKVKNRFVWIERQRERNVSGTMHDISQGILLYSYPYTNDSAFTNQQILAVRDSILKAHVPGPVSGSYMTTEYLLPPEKEVVSLDGEFAVEMRGLWRVEGAVMGGPWISLTTLDEANQRIVTAEGFVFAPKFNKREYLREVEAMIYSLEF